MTCTSECWAMPRCMACGRRKQPRGRDARDPGLCDTDCPGYRHLPYAGHLWPGDEAAEPREEAPDTKKGARDA